MKSVKKRKCFSDIMLSCGVTVFLLIAVIATLYPVLYIASMSLSSPEAVMHQEVFLIPKGFNIKSYIKLLGQSDVIQGYLNTLFYTFFGTVFSVVVTVLGAYAISQKQFFASKFITKMCLLTMYINGGMIANFLNIMKLGLYNTRWAIVFTSAVSMYTLIVTITYFKGYSDEIIEATKLDGCNELQSFFHIVLPTSKAIIAVNVLFYAVERWNTYFNAILYLRSQKLMPIQVYIAKVFDGASAIMQNGGDSSMAQSYTIIQMRYALIMVTIIPIICVYPLIQKYLIKGVMVGSLKG